MHAYSALIITHLRGWVSDPGLDPEGGGSKHTPSLSRFFPLKQMGGEDTIRPNSEAKDLVQIVHQMVTSRQLPAASANTLGLFPVPSHGILVL